jgi:hypothetical protein
MYEFATVALLGLAMAKLVDLLGQVRSVSRVTGMVLTILTGLGIAWATDYSAFGGWGIQFRELWMGTAATGLVIGALAMAWNEILAALGAYAARRARAASADNQVTRVA